MPVAASRSTWKERRHGRAELHRREVNAEDRLLRPGLSGKTTNLEFIHERAPEARAARWSR